MDNLVCVNKQEITVGFPAPFQISEKVGSIPQRETKEEPAVTTRVNTSILWLTHHQVALSKPVPALLSPKTAPANKRSTPLETFGFRSLWDVPCPNSHLQQLGIEPARPHLGPVRPLPLLERVVGPLAHVLGPVGPRE